MWAQSGEISSETWPSLLQRQKVPHRTTRGRSFEISSVTFHSWRTPANPSTQQHAKDEVLLFLYNNGPWTAYGCVEKRIHYLRIGWQQTRSTWHCNRKCRSYLLDVQANGVCSLVRRAPRAENCCKHAITALLPLATQLRKWLSGEHLCIVPLHVCITCTSVC